MTRAVSLVNTYVRIVLMTDIAQRTADHLGVKYLKTHMSEQTLADSFEDATYHIEHHNHDCNYIGKYVLSKLPREHGYKVVLTGEGADEQFGGYPLFLPDFLREEGDNKDQAVAEATKVVKKSYDMIGADSSHFDNTRPPLPLSTPAAMSAFTPAPSLFKRPSATSPLETIALNLTPQIHRSINLLWHPLHSAQYVWQKGHLANQFLSCLGDRVEMSHSVEARTPFLDHPLTEYINGLPPNLKIRARKSENGGTEYVEKYALREATKEFVTEEVYKRRKYPYTAPTTYPIGGPIHRLLDRLVTKDKVNGLGFLRWEEVEKLKELAFDEAESSDLARKTWAWRQIIMVAQWVVIGDRFGVRMDQ